SVGNANRKRVECHSGCRQMVAVGRKLACLDLTHQSDSEHYPAGWRPTLPPRKNMPGAAFQTSGQLEGPWPGQNSVSVGPLPARLCSMEVHRATANHQVKTASGAALGNVIFLNGAGFMCLSAHKKSASFKGSAQQWLVLSLSLDDKQHWEMTTESLRKRAREGEWGGRPTWYSDPHLDLL
ncbi:Chaperone protein DnaJ, partial [Dissostichus eleginoides]